MKRLPFFLFASLVACSAAPPPPPAPKPVAPPPPAAPPPLAGRWIDADAPSFVGPERGDGVLLVVSGQRVLVSKSGAATRETAPSPEPIASVIEVPAKGGMKLVAATAHAILRLDDPLGAPVSIVRTESAIEQIGSIPGGVVVWTSDGDLPKAFDLETGAPAAFKMPSPPLRSVAFVDAQRGAAVLELVGPVATTDGGATWSPLTSTTPSDAIRMSGVSQRHGQLVAFITKDVQEASVDPASHKLGALDDVKAPATEAPLVKWIRRTGSDPLVLAAANGIAISNDEALVADHSLVARVDLKAGLVTEIVEIAKEPLVESCSLTRAGEAAAWVGCGLAMDPMADAFRPWGVLRVDFSGPKLKIEKAGLETDVTGQLVGSPSGGVLFFAPCKSDDDGQVCVRQHDGSWKTMHLEFDPAPHGTNALADGRMVYFRNVQPEDPGTDEEKNANALYVVAADEHDKEEVLVKLPVGFEQAGEATAATPIEEDADHTIHGAIVANGEAMFFSAKPGGAVQIFKHADSVGAAYHAGHALALLSESVVTSLDGAATWMETSARENLSEDIQRASGWSEESSSGVSEVGFRMGRQARVGWGKEEKAAAVEAPKLGGAVLPARKRSQWVSPKAEKSLECKSEGAAQGTPPFSGWTSVKDVLASKPAPKGTRRETSMHSGSSYGLFDNVAILEAEGKDDKDALPTKWTLKWLDGRGVGERVRVATLAAPHDTGRGVSLRNAHADGARAIFSIRSGQRTLLVRVKGNGQTEVVDDKTTGGFGYEAPVFGVDKGEPIAWLTGNALTVWLAGEQPRVIGRVATNAFHYLGQPTKDGVPVLGSRLFWSLERTFPLSGDGSVSLDGWTPAPEIARDLRSLDVCAPAAAKGTRFLLRQIQDATKVDGEIENGGTAVFDVRVSGADACLAGESAVLIPPRAPSSPPLKPGEKPKPKAAKGPVGFVRVDLVGKHADGGDPGAPPKGSVRRMTCSLGAKILK